MGKKKKKTKPADFPGGSRDTYDLIKREIEALDRGGPGFQHGE